MKKVIALTGIVLLLAVAGYFFFGKQLLKSPTAVLKSPTIGTGSTKLTYAIHWSEKAQQEGILKDGVLISKGLNQYLEEYTKLNPDVSFEVQVIQYGEYADKIKVLSDADMAPDIYQIYSPWGVSYVQAGILDKPPADVIADVKKNYLSVDGVTINGDIWGIPTEINDYALLYNKDLFKQAGLTNPPKTWAELVEMAVKLTKKDEKGNITQYGIAFNSEDWQVVNPFLTLLYSNGGQFLSEDLKKSLFNSPQGVAALDSILQLFRKGATDANGNFFDFGKNKVAMVVSPPWPKASIQTSFGEAFASTVGVAPFPPLGKPATFGYTWFMGVTAKSAYKTEAWEFLKWFSSEVQPETGTTRYGDLLAQTIGAIPSRKVDFQSHKEELGDFFTKVFIDQMKYTNVEPNVAESSTIKTILIKNIQTAWSGQKTAKEALDAAAIDVDKILQTYYVK